MVPLCTRVPQVAFSSLICPPLVFRVPCKNSCCTHLYYFDVDDNRSTTAIKYQKEQSPKRMASGSAIFSSVNQDNLVFYKRKRESIHLHHHHQPTTTTTTTTTTSTTTTTTVCTVVVVVVAAAVVVTMYDEALCLP